MSLSPELLSPESGLRELNTSLLTLERQYFSYIFIVHVKVKQIRHEKPLTICCLRGTVRRMLAFLFTFAVAAAVFGGYVLVPILVHEVSWGLSERGWTTSFPWEHDGKSPYPVLIYILCHDNVSEASARAGFSRYVWAQVERIPTSPLFENAVFLRVDDLAKRDSWASRKFVGTLSYRAFEKYRSLRFYSEKLIRLLARVDNMSAEAPDAVSFLSEGAPRLFGGVSALDHPEFDAVWNSTVCGAVDPRLCLPFRAWYCNYWVARPQHWMAYAHWLRDTVLPSLQADKRLVETNQVMYVIGSTARPPSSDMIGMGMHQFPMMPFILERLPGAYFQHIYTGLYLQGLPWPPY